MVTLVSLWLPSACGHLTPTHQMPSSYGGDIEEYSGVPPIWGRGTYGGLEGQCLPLALRLQPHMLLTGRCLFPSFLISTH